LITISTTLFPITSSPLFKLSTNSHHLHVPLTKLSFPIYHTLAVPNISSCCSSIPPATESPLPYHFTLISRPAFKRVDLTVYHLQHRFQVVFLFTQSFNHSPYVAFLPTSTLPLCYFPTKINITLMFLSCQHQRYPLAFNLLGRGKTDQSSSRRLLTKIGPPRFVAQSLKMTYRAPPTFTAAQ